MHYCLNDSDISLFTTGGMKTHDIEVNPEVCLQVEKIDNPLHWRSVIINGRAERLTEQPDIDHARQFVQQQNPALSPAINRIAWATLRPDPGLLPGAGASTFLGK